MNWDQIQVNWMAFKNKVRANWVKLTDEDVTRVGGRREELVAHIAQEAGIETRAAGIALALVLEQLDEIGRDAGVRTVLEYRPGS